MGVAQPSGPPQPMYDASNTNVLGHAGRVLSLTEGAMPYELSRELDTLQRTDFGGPLPTGFTAHPKIDPETGELHGFAYSWADPNLIYHVIDASGKLVRSERITVPGPTMIHDFALTRTHVVFFDLPVVFDLDMVTRGLPMPYRWDADYGARVGIMPRDGGDADVSWFDVEPCYVFHPMNAYDDGDTVVVDVVRHPTMCARSA
jgi:carotenoid cleavage dioxygenase